MSIFPDQTVINPSGQGHSLFVLHCSSAQQESGTLSIQWIFFELMNERPGVIFLEQVTSLLSASVFLPDKWDDKSCLEEWLWRLMEITRPKARLRGGSAHLGSLPCFLSLVRTNYQTLGNRHWDGIWGRIKGCLAHSRCSFELKQRIPESLWERST